MNEISNIMLNSDKLFFNFDDDPDFGGDFYFKRLGFSIHQSYSAIGNKTDDPQIILRRKGSDLEKGPSVFREYMGGPAKATQLGLLCLRVEELRMKYKRTIVQRVYNDTLLQIRD